MKLIRELARLQAEYLVFLSKEYDKAYNNAHVHGFRCDPKDINTGDKLREAIRKAEEEVE